MLNFSDADIVARRLRDGILTSHDEVAKADEKFLQTHDLAKISTDGHKHYGLLEKCF